MTLRKTLNTKYTSVTVQSTHKEKQRFKSQDSRQNAKLYVSYPTTEWFGTTRHNK